MTDLEKYIDSYFGVSHDNLAEITSFFKESALEKGAYFVKAGQYCQKLSFVQRGFIRIFAPAGEKDVTQWVSSKGYFVTDLYSFVFKQRARWNIQALTDCTLYTIEKEDYTRLNEVVPNWCELEKRFIAGCFLTLEDRVFNHLSCSAEERYNQLFEYNKELFNQVPSQYLASMLGMTPETFSRIRNKKRS